MEVSGCFKKYIGRDDFLNVDFGHDRIHFGSSNNKIAFVSDDASAYIEKKFPGEFRTIADPKNDEKVSALIKENVELKSENKKMIQKIEALESSLKTLHEAVHSSKNERKNRNG